jgi:hypothetical protein
VVKVKPINFSKISKLSKKGVSVQAEGKAGNAVLETVGVSCRIHNKLKTHLKIGY